VTAFAAAPVPAGLLLPQSTLTQPWFLLLALVVAFNTIIYLGLTFAKLVPWPAQIHPRRVRALLPNLITKDTTMRDVPRSDRLSSEQPYLWMRLRAAQETIPRAFGLGGGLVLAVTFVNAVFSPDGSLASRELSALLGIAMLILAIVCGRLSVAPRAMIWIWSVTMTLLVIKLSWDGIEFDNPVALTYAVIAMVFSSAISMSWAPSIATGAINLVVITLAGVVIEAVDTPRWFLAALAGLAAGLVLMQVRINSTDSLSLEQMKSNLLASTDPLTGLLTRNGLLVLASSLSAAVERTGGNVYVSLVDINDLARANADYGMAYGDSVVTSVGRAITASVPEGDLIARWDGDCFLVLGIGDRPDATDFRTRIDEAIAFSGVTLGKIPVTVSVGSASGNPSLTTIDALVTASAAELATPEGTSLQ
jgi:diguanylate cyclase (GGDEF)-like protein